MRSKEQLINEFMAFIPFVKSLRSLDNERWVIPIDVGKWSIKDIICHIMLWDKYFFEEAVEKITNNQPLTVQHLNFDEFNKNAIEYGKNKGIEEIIEQTIFYRNLLISHLTQIPETDFMKEYIDGDGTIFTVRGYIEGFVPHDNQHKFQIETFINSLRCDSF